MPVGEQPLTVNFSMKLLQIILENDKLPLMSGANKAIRDLKVFDLLKLLTMKSTSLLVHLYLFRSYLKIKNDLTTKICSMFKYHKILLL